MGVDVNGLHGAGGVPNPAVTFTVAKPLSACGADVEDTNPST